MRLIRLVHKKSNTLGQGTGGARPGGADGAGIRFLRRSSHVSWDNLGTLPGGGTPCLGLALKGGETSDRGGEHPEQSCGDGKGQNRWWDVAQAWLEQRDKEEEGTRTGIY